MPFPARKSKSKVQATAITYATDLLARRSYAIPELLRKLRAKGYSQEESQEAVDKFVERGIVSNDSFAEQLCYEAERSGKGRRWLINKMHEVGLESGEIEHLLLDNDFDQDKELVVLKSYFIRHYGENHLFAGPKEQASALRHLQGRGFAVGNIFKVLRSCSGADFIQEFSEED